MYNPYAPVFRQNPYYSDDNQTQQIVKDMINFKSITLWLVIIQISIFMITLIIMLLLQTNDFSCVLYLLGAKHTPSIRYKSEFYRLICPIFLHSGLFHLAANTFSQIMLGFRFEKQLSLQKYLYLYFMSGIGGNLLSCHVFKYGLSVGASGAIFGFIGCEGAYLLKNHPNNSKQRLAWFAIIISLGCLQCFTPHSKIDFAGHLGGFVVGFLIGATYFQRGRMKTQFISVITILILLLFTGLLMSIFLIDLKQRFLCQK